jgi:4-aminobutyrate aminotransferase-like enzyme
MNAMARSKASPLNDLLDSPRVRDAARALVDAVAEEAAERQLSDGAYQRAVKEIGRLRGRPLFWPALSGGTGRGARVRMADGDTKLDFISGIGVYGFGHADPDLLETAVVAAAGDSVFQGHLFPGAEYARLSRALLRHAGTQLKHVWLSVSGAIANENALKMIYQKHAPADLMLAFDGAFAGRTLAMAEITDKPGFRDGLPMTGRVLHVPFYDSAAADPIGRSVAALEAHFARHPGRIAGMSFELIQGEGGFRCAPREFFVALMERCRANHVAVWVDEVQTFGRTGDLFAFRTFDLDDYVDLVTAGKTLQGSAVLFRRAYNPRAGLIAGTYAGSTVGMAVGTRIIERLESEGFLGPEGRVAVLGGRFERRLSALRKRMPKAVGAHSGMGAMQAFIPFDGAPATVKAIVEASFDEGLMVFSAGANPMKIRMLLPLNVTDEELESGFAMLERAMRRVAEEQDLPC